MRWTVVIPAKALPGAKSRLLPASADQDAHRRLVESIRADTMSAARSAAGTARVLVVADNSDVPGAFVQTRPGLNAALGEAADHATRTWPADGVVALVGDLPALQPEALAAALAAAAQHARSFVADAPGTGTTMLAALPGTPLWPAFGRDSAARHAAVAALLDAAPSLRHDVDTAEDLLAAAALGLGPATSAVLSRSAVFVRSTGHGMIAT
ncbi:MAG TPA: 2-phospho-L-lactate guanylyltransferase [Jatrophihabitans sp.]|jgi:2-phospho-L-lactate guanylyltransferase|nr:2-phospho-L-lactate guanylyltransferase [Jatrophihabitans sp.]